MRLALLIPIYNERPTLPKLIEKLDATPPPRDARGHPAERLLILVDDGSRDGSADLVRELGQRPDVRAVVQERNQGKGAAIRRAIQEALSANADLALIQDADLEYDPADHQSVLAPLIDGRADAVIGSRFLGQTHRVLYYWHFVANTALTRLSNMLSNLNLTDMECGTKAFSRDVLQRLTLAEDRFGLEPELVARLAHMRLDQPPRPLRIYEVPVSYAGRTYADGKKITWRDGFSALRCIVQYNIFR